MPNSLKTKLSKSKTKTAKNLGSSGINMSTTAKSIELSEEEVGKLYSVEKPDNYRKNNII